MSAGKHRAPRRPDESGIAMVSIIGLTAVLTLLSVVAINVVLNAQTFSRNHQDWNAALAAAEAGVDDYLARLNRDRTYFERAELDLDADGRNLNPAIDRWAQLPNSDAWYHYRVDPSEVTQTGTITLTSIGRVRDEQRVIQVRIRPESFFDFIYFTDYEIVDPNVSGRGECVPESPGTGYFGDRPDACDNIRFIDDDIIDGPAHSNDALQIEGSPEFRGATSTSYNQPDGGFVAFDGRPASPVFSRDGDPVWDDRKVFPPTNDGRFSDAQDFGCVYYGPTYIEITGDTMWVKSPLSGNPPADAPARRTDDCGTDADLQTFTSGIEVPPVIYVADAAGCGSFSNANHPLGLDRGEESISSLRYECADGDVFVWGELEGQTTIQAANNINIIWDLVYKDRVWQDGTNILGLVADNFVQVRQPTRGLRNNDPVAGEDPFRPGQPTPKSADRYFRDPEIHAAILALNRSFRVQNHDETEELGDLRVYGSISQQYRGPVGTTRGDGSSTGFLKDYRYDDRLQFISPPFFIDPVRSVYVTRNWAEVTTSTGFPDPDNGIPTFPNPDPDDDEDD